MDNSQAPLGLNIIHAFDRGLSRQQTTGLLTLTVDRELGRPATVATFAGRIFYAGMISSVVGGDNRSPIYSGFILFSQIAFSKDDLGKCYQVADPTSNTISDLVDTDGGTIQIPDITLIYKLVPTKSSLLVFAQNGVWEIFGDTGGFTATSYQTAKVSSIGTISPQSIIEINGTILYWAKSGIFVLTQEEVTGRYQAENITIKTIQTLYINIPSVARENSVGFYDEQENRVRWLYNDSVDYSSTNYINKYNKELVLDLTLQAFYTSTISPLLSSSPFVCGYVDIPRFFSIFAEDAVYFGLEEVLFGTEPVVTPIIQSVSRNSQFSYLTFVDTSFTFSKYRNTKFLDWFSADSIGVDYSSFLITGYNILGDLFRRKQISYMSMVFTRTEDGFTLVGADLLLDNPSSCLVQVQWGWSDSANSGKWGTQFQAYKLKRNYTPSGESDTFNYGESVVTSKNKLRGSGKAISLKIQSETGKDLRLLGWAISVEAGAAV